MKMVNKSFSCIELCYFAEYLPNLTHDMKRLKLFYEMNFTCRVTIQNKKMTAESNENKTKPVRDWMVFYTSAKYTVCKIYCLQK